MKKTLLTILILSAFIGCASLQLKPFTDISFMEIQSENIRAYHIRYSGNVAVDFDLANKLRFIEGVQILYALPFQCTISKSPAYSWEEIETEITAILLEFEADIKDGFIGEVVEEQPEEKDGV